MQVQANTQINSITFNSRIKKETLELLYKEGIKCSENEKTRNLALQLHNTIQAVKKDGKKNVFSVTHESRTIPLQWEPDVYCTIKYGESIKEKRADSFPEDKFFIVKTVIDWGKEHFGLAKINAPITKLKKADRLKEQYENLLQKASNINNRADEEYINTYKKLFNINV